MVKETEVMNDEFIPQNRMTLVGVTPMSFEVKNDDGSSEKIEGCKLHWLFFPDKNSTTLGRQVSSEFRKDTKAENWKIDTVYVPDIKIVVVGGKPVPKIIGYKTEN